MKPQASIPRLIRRTRRSPDAPAKIVTDTPGCHCPHCCVSDEVMEARMDAIYSKSPSERLATQVPFDDIKDCIGDLIVFLQQLAEDPAYAVDPAEEQLLADAHSLLWCLHGNERPLRGESLAVHASDGLGYTRTRRTA